MTKPPVRLMDDPGALASLRTNLQRVREADGGYDASRGLARLQSELSALGTQGTAPQAPATDAWRLAAYGGNKALWLALGGATVIAASALIVTLQQRARPVPKVPEARVLTVPVQLPVITPSLEASAPEPVIERTEEAPGISMRREIEQLAEMRALLPRKPGAAYQLALRSAREFPQGALREEREALTALALSQMGEREQARKLARAFLLRYPSSPLRGTLERLMEEAPQ